MLGQFFKNKIFRNASWLVGCKVVKAVLSFVITILTARFLGSSGYGLISYAASIVVFVEPIAQLGLRDIQVHELVKTPEREGELLGTSMFMSFIAAAFSIIGIFFFVLMVNASETDTLIVCVLYSVMLLCQVGELLQYWFQAKYLMKYPAIIGLIAYFMVSVYKAVLLITSQSIYLFALSNAIDFLIISVFLFIFYKKKGGIKLKVSFKIVGELWAKSKYFIIPNLMISVFSQTDRIMLKIMIGNSATGFYTAAYMCASVGNFVFLAIIDAARPSIFQKYNTDKKAFNHRISQLYCVIIYSSLIMSAGMTVFADFNIRITYGTEYAAASAALRVVVWFSTFSYIGTVNSIWILANRKEKLLWIINLSGALANILFNLILIPKMDIVGAAIASLVTQFVSNIIVVAIIPSTRPIMKRLLKSLNIFKMIKKDGEKDDFGNSADI